ncbi:MAG: hypothetical protein KC657_33225 [Myxococcales bacterium]|nr:hypothetical protein [Myxococcales bacterium]
MRKGWSSARVLGELGPPTSCDRNEWSYVAGVYTGPEMTYRFRFENGVVQQITTSSVGCRLVE